MRKLLNLIHTRKPQFVAIKTTPHALQTYSNIRKFHNGKQHFSNKDNSDSFVKRMLLHGSAGNALKNFFSPALNKLLFAVALAFFCWLLERFYYSLTKVNRIAKTFVETSTQTQKIDPNYISRPRIEEDILELFDTDCKYVLIYGEHGIGKTTLVNEVIRQVRNDGRPTFYISFENDQGSNFVESFAVALKGFDVIPEIRALDGELLLKNNFGIVTPSSIGSLFPDIAAAGRLLQKKTNKRPLLVIDACNNLDEQSLKQLQDFAKAQADKREMLVVFVSCDDNAPEVLFSSSASSRMISYRIGELNEEEAHHFLEHHKNIKDAHQRANILAITGYSFQYLTANCNDIQRLEKHVKESIDSYLKESGISRWFSEPKMVDIVDTILKNKYITLSYFYEGLQDTDRADCILQGSVFTSCYSEDFGEGEKIIVFQNTATRNYFNTIMRKRALHQH